MQNICENHVEGKLTLQEICDVGIRYDLSFFFCVCVCDKLCQYKIKAITVTAKYLISERI